MSKDDFQLAAEGESPKVLSALRRPEVVAVRRLPRPAPTPPTGELRDVEAGRDERERVNVPLPRRRAVERAELRHDRRAVGDDVDELRELYPDLGFVAGATRERERDRRRALRAVAPVECPTPEVADNRPRKLPRLGTAGRRSDGGDRDGSGGDRRGRRVLRTPLGTDTKSVRQDTRRARARRHDGLVDTSRSGWRNDGGGRERGHRHHAPPSRRRSERTTTFSVRANRRA